MTVGGRRPREFLADIGLFVLPSLATVALYLPSGVLMPFRLVTFGLVALAVVRIAARERTVDRVIIALGGLAAIVGVFGLVGWLRYGIGPGAVDDAVRVALLLSLAIAVAILATPRSVVWLLAGWCAAAALAIPVALWEIASGDHLPKNLYKLDAPSFDWNPIASWFDNPNLLAYQCALILLVLPLAISVLPRWASWLALPAAAIIAFVLLATNGRLALLGVFVAVLLWLARSKWGWLGIGVGVAGFAALVAAGFAPARRLWLLTLQVISTFDPHGDPRDAARLSLAKSGWWIAQQTQFLGTGPGGFSTWSIRPDNPYKWNQLNNAHSGLVEILSEYGIVAAALTLAALTLVVVYGWRSARIEPRGTPAIAAFVAVTLAATWVVLSACHSTWLRQPLSAMHIATIVVLISAFSWRGRAASKPVPAAP